MVELMKPNLDDVIVDVVVEGKPHDVATVEHQVHHRVVVDELLSVELGQKHDTRLFWRDGKVTR